mgnify:CR=1 FL=1
MLRVNMVSRDKHGELYYDHDSPNPTDSRPN